MICRYLGILGGCVVGGSVAQKLCLKVGDSILSSPQNLFALGRVYPWKMKIVGILENNQTAYELAIFVELKTAWIIEGLGQAEMKTKFYLGCSRSTITQLITAEILIIVLISSSLTFGITLGMNNFNRQVIRALIL